MCLYQITFILAFSSSSIFFNNSSLRFLCCSAYLYRLLSLGKTALCLGATIAISGLFFLTSNILNVLQSTNDLTSNFFNELAMLELLLVIRESLRLLVFSNGFFICSMYARSLNVLLTEMFSLLANSLVWFFWAPTIMQKKIGIMY